MARITVTTTADSGSGSLREAIANASNGDTIVFASDLANQTIRLEEQLSVDKSITLDGADASNLTLSGQNKTRILHIAYNYVDVAVRNLTFANGRAADNDPNTKLQGGAIELRDPNTLVVENSRFINNSAERGGAIHVGYGASATIIDSDFEGNDGTLADDGFSSGAISTLGGGEGAQVVNRRGDREVGGNAFLDIRGSTFTDNKGSYGAVYTLLGGLRVEDSVFRNNEGTRGSGAIFTDGANGTERADDLGGTTIIRNVIAENNQGGGNYGGAFYFYGYSGDTYIIENTRVTGNSAFRGGGIGAQSARDEDDGVELIIRNSVIADNTASSQGGGLWTDVKGGVTIEDSTFSGNRVTTPDGGGDIGGAIVLNTPEQAESTITNTTFVDNYADRQSGNIWIGGRDKAKKVTISDSRFAGNRAGTRDTENTANFEVNDGGGNVVQSATGVDGGLPNATLVENLQLEPEVPVVEEPTEEAPVEEEQPVVEEPVAEEPIEEDQPTAEEPVEEAPVEEAPAVEEQPVVAEPVAEEPVEEEQPVAEEPVEETPVEEEQPVAEEPAQEVPVAEEPIEEVPPVAEEDPVAEEPLEEAEVEIPEGELTLDSPEIADPQPTDPQPEPDPLPLEQEPALETESPTELIRFDAEDLTLKGYRLRTEPGNHDNRIATLESGNKVGKAKGVFEGPAGTYQVKLGYFDENDGQGSFKVKVAGESESFKLDQDLPSRRPDARAKAERITHEVIDLEPGDRFVIRGRRDGGEMARFDYIEFSPIDANPGVVQNASETPLPTEAGSRIASGILDLRNVDYNADGTPDQAVSVDLSDIKSFASYDNFGGFYRAERANGAVRDPLTDKLIRPGQEGYAEAALEQRVSELSFHAEDGQMSATVETGTFLVPYLVTNGDAEAFLEQNPLNERTRDRLNAYFGIGEANPDGLDHIKVAGSSRFSFEDLYGLGDKSFDDLSYTVDVGAA